MMSTRELRSRQGDSACPGTPLVKTDRASSGEDGSPLTPTGRDVTRMATKLNILPGIYLRGTEACPHKLTLRCARQVSGRPCGRSLSSAPW